MKAISLHQPWATAVAIGLKKIETRSWAPKRPVGPLLIHSTQYPSGGTLKARRILFERWLENDVIRLYFEDSLDLDFDCLAFGSLLARVNFDWFSSTELLDPDETERQLGDFSPDRYGWGFNNVIKFEQPIQIRGRQGLWDVPDYMIPDAAFV